MFYITFTLLWYTLAMQPRACIDIRITAADAHGVQCVTGRASGRSPYDGGS